MGTLSFEKHWANPKTDVVDPHRTKNRQNAPSCTAESDTYFPPFLTKVRQFFRTTECQEEKPLEFEDIVDKKTYDKMRPPKPGGM